MSEAWRWFVAFFAEKDASFTFGGLAHFAGELLSLIGGAILLRVTTKTPRVSVSLVEPLGLLDVHQYAESFELRGTALVPQIRVAFAGLLQMDPASFPGPQHVIATWDASAPGDVHRRSRVFSHAEAFPFPTTGEEHVAYAKRLLRLDHDQVVSFPESPASIMLWFGLPDSWTDVMKPANPRSRYVRREGWESSSAFRSIPDFPSKLEACIESSGADALSRAIALEQIYVARLFINWLEIKNESRHAVAPAVRVVVDHFSRGEAEVIPVGNFSEFERSKAGYHFSGTARNILPGETRWAVVRSRLPIRSNELRTFVDPTPFFHPGYFRVIAAMAGVVAILWVAANVARMFGSPP